VVDPGLQYGSTHARLGCHGDSGAGSYNLHQSGTELPRICPVNHWHGGYGVRQYWDSLHVEESIKRSDSRHHLGTAGRAGIATASERISEANQPAEAAKPVDLIEQGEGLFVAKGCVSCHLNRRVDSRYLVFSTEIGSDLTNYPTSSKYLQLWLSNPASVKPKTEMPNLNLSQTEIGALIAFLLQDSSE